MMRRRGDSATSGSATGGNDRDVKSSAKVSAKVRSKAAKAPARRARCCSWTACLLLLLLVSLISAALLRTQAGRVRVMRLIRDLGRYKSRARLLRDSTGLIPLLLGREPDSSLSRDDEELATVLTAAELAQYTGEGDTPIYLAITGRVYDVSRGRAFYGPGRSYHSYVGRDATRSYATGCLRIECLISSLAGLTDLQKREAERWVDFYEYHDKYTFVGVLREDPVETAVERAWAMEEAIKNVASGIFAAALDAQGLSGEELMRKGTASYKQGEFDEALQFWSSALVRLGEAQRGNDIAVVRQRATVLMYMVAACQKHGDTAQAMEYVQEAIDSLTEALGPEVSNMHPLLARAASDRAVLLLQEGQVEEAREGFVRAIAVYERALAGGAGGSGVKYVEEAGGRDAVFVEAASSRHNLARLYEMTHSFGKALELANEVLEAFRDDDGAERPAMVQGMLENAYRMAQRLEALYDDEYEDGGFDDLY